MVAKHVNKKKPGKTRVLAINALLPSFAVVAATFSAAVLFIVTFNNDGMPLPK